MESPSWSWGKTALCVGAGVVAVGLGTYAVKSYIDKRRLENRDEGFEDTSKSEDIPEKRILVLGLDGAGKTSILSGLRQQEIRETPKPTEGFNVMCVNTDGKNFNIWEIGGAENVRQYWSNFTQDTDILVYVVDSSDESRLPEAFTELHKLMGDDRLRSVPIILLANKQDKADSQSPEQIQHAVAMDNLSPREHKVRVLATQAPVGGESKGITELENLLNSLTGS